MCAIWLHFSGLGLVLLLAPLILYLYRLTVIQVQSFIVVSTNETEEDKRATLALALGAHSDIIRKQGEREEERTALYV